MNSNTGLLQMCYNSIIEKNWVSQTSQILRIILLIIFNVYLFLRERDSVSEGGAERETQTEAAPGSELSAQSLTRGMNSRTMRS